MYILLYYWANKMMMMMMITQFLHAGCSSWCPTNSVNSKHWKHTANNCCQNTESNKASPSTYIFALLRLLGVIISSDLSLQRHVSNMYVTSFYWLRQLRRVRRSFDSNRVSGYTCSRIRDLPHWPVQCHTCRSHEVCHWHSAACYECCCTCRQWHKKVWPWSDSNLAWWLTLAQCGKSSNVQTRCHHAQMSAWQGTARPVDCCTLVTNVVGRQCLWSASQQLMVMPRHRLCTVGCRAFSVHGPMIWNSLLDDLRAQQDYESFSQGLKTWLFSRY